MCEANAYLQDGENEMLFMEAVDTIGPYENGLKLMDIFGKQMFIHQRFLQKGEDQHGSSSLVTSK